MTKVSILCPDLANNCLGRADLLGRMLKPHHDVAIVGPAFGPVWEPLRDQTTLSYVPIPAPRQGMAGGREAWRKVEAALDGDVVYVSKPFGTSLMAAHRVARRRGSALMLDVDDWELGFLRQQLAERASLPRRLRFLATAKGKHYREPWNVLLGEARSRSVATRTVSNRFLQERYGGTLVWHARDPVEFDPARFDGAAERARLGIAPRRKVVLFLGTPRSHKGIEDLVEAVALLPDPEVLLLVVGVDAAAYSKSIAAYAKRRLGDRVLLLPPQPFATAPRFLALADVAVIPQRDAPAARGQMPAKVFDAMVMGRPLVATRVSDLPEVVGDCGLLVAPGDAAGMAQALRSLLEDADLARRLGQAARRRAIAHYSLQAVGRTLDGVVREALGGSSALG